MENDLISRQAAIDAVHKAVLEMFDYCDDDIEEPMTYTEEKMLEVNKLITDKIRDLPSAQPEQRWIPCSERLPKSGRYLVSSNPSLFSPQVLNYDAENKEWFYDGCKSMGYEMPHIVAWMPLPEPYKEKSQK